MTLGENNIIEIPYPDQNKGGEVSAQTRATLEEAIAAHVADECDGKLPGAWIVLVETLGLDDDASTWHAETEGSDFTIRGLLTFQQGTYLSIDNGGPDD